MTDVQINANKTAQTLSFAVDMSLARLMPSGVESRVYNFVYGDIPVMLHLAGYPITDPTPHQKTLLDMPASDFCRQAGQNYEAAVKILKWTAPQNELAVNQFMGDGNIEYSEVRKLLEHYQENHQSFITPSQSIRNNAVIVNDIISPLDTESFETANQNIRAGGNLLSGMHVYIREDPQGRIPREIEATVLQSRGDNAYQAYQKISGIKDLVGESELVDTRGIEHMYGVVLEDKGQHYIVQIDSPSGQNPYMLSTPVREVSGIAGAYITKHCTGLNDALDMDANNQHKIPATCGEFTIRSLRGIDDSKGPCTIIASPWQSKPDEREMKIAYHLLQAYHAQHDREPDTSIRLITRTGENRDQQMGRIDPTHAAAMLFQHDR